MTVTSLKNHYYNLWSGAPNCIMSAAHAKGKWCCSGSQTVAVDTFHLFLCVKQLQTAVHGSRFYSSLDSDRYALGMLTPATRESVFYSINNSPSCLFIFFSPEPGVSSTKTGYVRVLQFQTVNAIYDIIKNVGFGRILPWGLCDLTQSC